MKRTKHSYLYFFILAALSLPQFAAAQSSATTPPAISPPAHPIAVTAPPAAAPAPATPPVASTTTDDPSIDRSSSLTPPLFKTIPADPRGLGGSPTIPAVVTTLPAGRTVVQAPQPAVDYYLPASAGNSNESDSILSEADLKKAKLKIGFKEPNVELEGSLPSACANNLMMDVSSKDPEDAEADLSTIDGLNNASTSIGVRVTFKGNDKQKTLADCIKAEGSSSKVDVSTVDKLNKQILTATNENARMGLEDNDGEVTLGDKAITTKAYQANHDAISYLLCSNCKVNPKKIQAQLDNLKGQSAGAASLRAALLEKAIGNEGTVVDQINKADSLGQLDNVLQDLISYAKELDSLHADDGVDKDALKNFLTKRINELQDRVKQLAYADPKHVSKFADKVMKNASLIASHKEIFNKELTEHEAEVAKSFAKGGSERVRYIASINPGDTEVRDVLSSAQQEIHNAQVVANNDCKNTLFNHQRINSNACQQAIAHLQSLQSTAEALATRYQAAILHPEDPLPNPSNELAFNGTNLINGVPIKGYFPEGNGSFTPVINGANNQSGANSIFGQPSFIAQYSGASGMYTPGSQTMYSPLSPNYTTTNAAFRIQNQANQQSLMPAVPLNASLLPATNTGISFPQQFNGSNG